MTAVPARPSTASLRPHPMLLPVVRRTLVARSTAEELAGRHEYETGYSWPATVTTSATAQGSFAFMPMSLAFVEVGAGTGFGTQRGQMCCGSYRASARLEVRGHGAAQSRRAPLVDRRAGDEVSHRHGRVADR